MIHSCQRTPRDAFKCTQGISVSKLFSKTKSASKLAKHSKFIQLLDDQGIKIRNIIGDVPEELSKKHLLLIREKVRISLSLSLLLFIFYLELKSRMRMTSNFGEILLANDSVVVPILF